MVNSNNQHVHLKDIQNEEILKDIISILINNIFKNIKVNKYDSNQLSNHITKFIAFLERINDPYFIEQMMLELVETNFFISMYKRHNKNVLKLLPFHKIENKQSFIKIFSHLQLKLSELSCKYVRASSKDCTTIELWQEPRQQEPRQFVWMVDPGYYYRHSINITRFISNNLELHIYKWLLHQMIENEETLINDIDKFQKHQNFIESTLVNIFDKFSIEEQVDLLIPLCNYFGSTTHLVSEIQTDTIKSIVNENMKPRLVEYKAHLSRKKINQLIASFNKIGVFLSNNDLYEFLTTCKNDENERVKMLHQQNISTLFPEESEEEQTRIQHSVKITALTFNKTIGDQQKQEPTNDLDGDTFTSNVTVTSTYKVIAEVNYVFLNMNYLSTLKK